MRTSTHISKLYHILSTSLLCLKQIQQLHIKRICFQQPNMYIFVSNINASVPHRSSKERCHRVLYYLSAYANFIYDSYLSKASVISLIRVDKFLLISNQQQWPFLNFFCSIFLFLCIQQSKVQINIYLNRYAW